MKNIRIYQAGDYQPGSLIQLTESAGQHVGVVLRMLPGEKITLFSGNNLEFDAVISAVHKKKVSVEILSVAEVNRESPLAIHLAQAMSKGERMEWVVQKAVELGVSSIQPLVTRRCVVKLDQQRAAKKIAQWQAIAVAACEQSGRNQLPLIHPILSFEEYLAQNQDVDKLILHPQTEKSWRHYSFNFDELSLLIGPEGGFSQDEVRQAFAAGFMPLSLGPRVLRTETAAIAAISILQAAGGDL
ncbi:16S rRNA (uracil(1498)-N(3))-methyltransferase [Legionella israelensis]|uniref:Ribosomal RNA small subunit methyltransferase E n=1 Tax=Legionella israelensis TaxID=454 RepID=A0AAX1EJ48_9GAMM|nr:16S rRNA (uracil(1498)-N(3))-methyltransferase [Legionella israelensis]QBR85127.1 16S rRNA (uracil(1498)-N(3))-methyltransferase [Legionella israelensis]